MWFKKCTLKFEIWRYRGLDKTVRRVAWDHAGLRKVPTAGAAAPGGHCCRELRLGIQNASSCFWFFVRAANFTEPDFLVLFRVNCVFSEPKYRVKYNQRWCLEQNRRVCSNFITSKHTLLPSLFFPGMLIFQWRDGNYIKTDLANFDFLYKLSAKVRRCKLKLGGITEMTVGTLLDYSFVSGSFLFKYKLFYSAQYYGENFVIVLLKIL